jgi:hypothetical protein
MTQPTPVDTNVTDEGAKLAGTCGGAATVALGVGDEAGVEGDGVAE